jgi:hypothetical protein
MVPYQRLLAMTDEVVDCPLIAHCGSLAMVNSPSLGLHNPGVSLFCVLPLALVVPLALALARTGRFKLVWARGLQAAQVCHWQWQ